MAEQLTIDISILQGIFGDLQKVQAHLSGLTGGAAAVDRAMATSTANTSKAWNNVAGSVRAAESATDAAMRGMVGDMLAPLQRASELEQKLANLGDRVRTSKSVSEIRALRTEIQNTQRELDKVNAGGMESRVAGPASRLRGLFGSMAAPIAGAFAISGVTAFGSGLVNAAAKAQSFNTSMEVMLRSKAAADELTGNLTSFASKTPFEIGQLRDATTQLLAYRVSADQVIPTLTSLGNIAAGVGMDKLPQLMTAFGQVKAAGKLTGGELRQFTEAGVPILDELAKITGRTVESMAGNIAELSIPFATVQQALANMSGAGGQFENLMWVQSQTIGGTLSTLADDWNTFKESLGLSMAPLISSTIGGLQTLIGYLRDGFAWVQENAETLKTWFTGIAIAVGIYTTALLINNAAVLYNATLQGVATIASKGMLVVMNLVTAATTIWTGVQWLLNAALTANPIGIVVMAIAALVAGIVYCWEECEGFRMFLYSLWGSVSETFGAIWEIGKRVFGGLSDIVGGFVKTVKAAFTFDKALLQEGMLQQAKGMTTLLNTAANAPGEVFQGFVKGAVGGALEGQKSFAADQAEKQAEQAVLAGVAPSPGTKTATALTAQGGVATGNSLGATNLLGGTDGGTTKGKGGVTVGGSGSDGGRSIVMNVTMNNRFDLGKAGTVDIMAVVDQVIGKLTTKLNDAQFAVG